MRSRARFFLPVAALALVCAFAGRASACSCLSGEPVCEAFGSSRAVFVGKVLGAKQQRVLKDEEGKNQTFDVGEIYFQVEEAFSGVKQGSRAVIHSGTGGGDCGSWFKRGARYVVYAYGDTLNDLSTNICTRTRPLDEAEEDLAFLRNMPNKGAGARVYGAVVAAVKDPSSTDWRKPVPLGGITVKIGGGGQTYEAVTDAEGTYERTGLPPGDYKVRPVVPEQYDAGEYSVREVRVNDRGCAQEEFLVHNDSRIKGRVVEPEGRGLPKVRVSLIPVEGPDEVSWTTLDSDYADEQGRFELEQVPPGRYLLGVNIGSSPDEEAPYPRTFHPGVTDRAQAAVIEVGMGEKLKDIDIQLPPKLTRRAVSGTVVWPDGRPAAGAGVHLEDINFSGWCVNGCATETDAQGNFKLHGFAGYTYRVRASVMRNVKGKVKETSAEPPEVKLGADVHHLRLVLTKEDKDESGGEKKSP